MEKDVGDMIFDSIRYLYEKSKEEPESSARGLANSIWQSVRTTVVPLPVLPDEVDEWLYHHDGLIENSYEMLDITRIPDGNMAQLWFIERIMQDGYLWAGRYVEAPKPNNDNLIAQKACEPREPGLPRPEYKMAIAQKQIGRNRTANAFRFMAPNANPLLQINSGKRAALAEISYYEEWTDETEGQRVKNLASIFDVDGPCTVAVPFNGSWEILPRPRNRNMSICWVVEKTGISEEHGGPEDVYRVVDKVKGMFEIMCIPRGVYTFT